MKQTRFYTKWQWQMTGRVISDTVLWSSEMRGSLMLMKFLDDRYDESTLQEWIDRGELLGIRFYADAWRPVCSWKGDRHRYIWICSDKNTGTGIWHLDAAGRSVSTTPEGYAGWKEAKMRITRKRCAGRVCCDQQCAECNDRDRKENSVRLEVSFQKAAQNSRFSIAAVRRLSCRII